MVIAEFESRLKSGWRSEKQSLLARLRALEPPEFALLRDIWEYLRVSELMMLDTLNGRPENPDYVGKGCAKFGHFLYHLHHPHPQLKALIERDELARAAWSLAAHAAKPRSTIAPGFLESIKVVMAGWPIVDREGAIYGFNQYESLDPHWTQVLINLLIAMFHGRHSGATPCVKALIPGLNGKVRLGIVGSRGAGAYGSNGCAAVAVMKQLEAMNCDFLLYMGDAYCAGCGLPFISSHEMYSGGNGYIPHALGRDIFMQQGMTGCFALTFGKWIILGLDTSSNASAANLYMNGTLGEQQSAWLREYRQSLGGFDGKKILVLTQHEGLNFLGDSLTGLFNEVADAIGRAPDIWYWGHLHNGIAYSNASAAGKLGTRARCVGHSAIPYGFASGLMDASGRYPVASVDYFMQTPSPEGGMRVLNGFATLELGENGDITELFFEQGNATPVWRSVNGVRFA